MKVRGGKRNSQKGEKRSTATITVMTGEGEKAGRIAKCTGGRKENLSVGEHTAAGRGNKREGGRQGNSGKKRWRYSAEGQREKHNHQRKQCCWANDLI